MTEKERAEIAAVLVAAEQYIFSLIYSYMHPGKNVPLEAARSNLVNVIVATYEANK